MISKLEKFPLTLLCILFQESISLPFLYLAHAKKKNSIEKQFLVFVFSVHLFSRI